MINQPEDDGEEAKANGAVVGNNLAIEGSCHLEEINFENLITRFTSVSDRPTLPRQLSASLEDTTNEDFSII